MLIYSIDTNKLSNVSPGCLKNVTKSMESTNLTGVYGVGHSCVNYRLDNLRFLNISSIVPNKQSQDHLNHVA